SAGPGQWLANKEVQKWIRLAGGRVKHVHRCERPPIHPAVRRHPAGLGFWSCSADLSGNRMVVAYCAVLLAVPQGDVAPSEVERSTVAVIKGRGDVRC